MDLLATIFGLPAIAAAAMALTTALVIPRVLPSALAQRAALPLAKAAAFFAGYALLPRDWAPLVPQHSWHWLPYLALAAAVAAAAWPSTTAGHSPESESADPTT
jgi:hypothetical protein